MRRRDHLLALALVAAVIIGSVIGSRFPTFRLFFGWPDGGTWSNTIAWLESLALAGFAIWYFRDHVGKSLAAWWHHHHGPHVQHQLDAHHDRIMASLEEQLRRPEVGNPDGTAASRERMTGHP